MKNNRKNRALVKIRIKNSLKKSLQSFVGQTINSYNIGKISSTVEKTIADVDVQPITPASEITINFNL